MRELTPQQAVASDIKHLIHSQHHPTMTHAPKIWVKGVGTVITDMEGNDYLDGLAGLWNVNVGHGRLELARAAATQMQTLAYQSSYAGSSNLPAIELGERLAQITYPSINHFFFTSGGGESTESAIKTARFYWKAMGKPNKWKVISRELGYHGVTLAAMSATGIDAYWPMFEPRTPGFIHIPSPYPFHFNHNFKPDAKNPTPGIAAANLLEQAILREGADNIAAFIAEPVQGAGGVIVPQDDYFKRIREICDKYEVLLVADEVITGFGRTGRWFALDHWGIEPDIMDFAKGITSGYIPLGGIGVNTKIAEVINSAEFSKRWMHAFTYSGHPTCCAVALANLDYIEREDLVTRAAETGAYMVSQLKKLERLPQVGEVRGLGMMAAVELSEDRATRKRFDASKGYTEKLRVEAANRGLWSRAFKDNFYLSPPLTTTRKEVDKMVDILDQSIRAIFP